LLYASTKLEGLKGANFDQTIGIQIVQKALRIPCKTIVDNSGFEGSIVVEKLLEKKDFEYGYDAFHNEFTNMKKRGIIDPTKVVRTALIDAGSVASLMITTEAAIVSIPEKNAPAGGPGGMGGMGGMGGNDVKSALTNPN
jgi:chaperonin GroEL